MLAISGLIENDNLEYREIKELWMARNQLVYVHEDFHELRTSDMVNRLKQITQLFAIASKPGKSW
jgi:hypothetical protein